MSEEVKKQEIRGKITLEYRGDSGVPEVKFFGEIRPRDMNMVKMTVQRSWRMYMFKIGKKEVAKHEAAQEAIEAELTANKGKDKDESNTDRPTEAGSGSIETSSTGSGTDSGREGEEDILPDQSRPTSDDGGTDSSVQQEVGTDARVLQGRTQVGKGVGNKGSGSLKPRKGTGSNT